jgi:hypothetical protein
MLDSATGDLLEQAADLAGGTGRTLTLAALLQTWRKIKPCLPPTVEIDLYPSAHIDQAYEVKVPIGATIGRQRDRRALAVPMGRLDWWADQLTAAGADVRVAPPLGHER